VATPDEDAPLNLVSYGNVPFNEGLTGIAPAAASDPFTPRSKRPLSTATSENSPTKKARTGPIYPQFDPSEGPTELVIFFERLAQIPLTPLYRQLHNIDDQEIYLRHYFSASRHVLVEVGACASELVWRRAAGDIESSIVDPDEDEEPDPAAPQTKERLAKLEILNAIKHWDFSMPNLDPSSRGFNVTPKFLKLAQILKSSQPYGDNFRGLVIGAFYRILVSARSINPPVKKKAVAQEMVDLIRTVEELDFLRPQLLVGRKMHQNPQAQARMGF
jgi:endoribonuclease Dicer